MRVTSSLICAAIMPLALAAPAWAVPITFGFTGTVDQVTDPSGVLTGKVWPQASFAGEFTFDSEAQDLNSSTQYGSYKGDDFLLTMQVGTLDFDSSAGHESITVFNSAIRNGLTFFAGEFDAGPIHVSELGLGIDDPSYPFFTNDHLPTVPPPLSIFQDHALTIVGAGVNIQGTIDSLYLVPEPGSGILLAICGLALSRRRSQHRAIRSESSSFSAVD